MPTLFHKLGQLFQVIIGAILGSKKEITVREMTKNDYLRG